ncbi:unnamed protein product [Orchesella dallaii]|uniref:Neurotransmitter-gated ion-channel ligand-binding domain-containing protein n=1 Tax=Orchesella dallaii TaxID=48710 RepID=A0ABP1QMV8_9HEXA
MNKIFILCAVIIAVIYAAPDSSLDLADPVSTLAETVTTSAQLALPTTERREYETSDEQGTVDDRTKLVATLFKDYDKKINPDDVKLMFGVSLIDFHILEDKDEMESSVWLRYSWQDPRLKWNADEYGGATLIRLESDMVWKPDIALFNSADPVNMMNCWNANILIYSTGKILWVPPCKMLSWCHLTLHREPYGEQVCGLKFGSWTFDGDKLDLDFYKGNKTMDVSDLINTSGFEILSNKAEQTTKFYPCCKEPYRDLMFNITIKRIPGEELIKKW